MNTCPCKLPESGDRMYHCDRLDCDMTPHWCMLYQTRENYRQAWDEGRGPGQGLGPRHPPPKPPSGPGTELKRLLRWLFLGTTLGCGCNAMATKMNQWGPDGCRENMDAILDHMAKEAKKRKLPFIRVGARRLVLLAIRRAERKDSLGGMTPAVLQ